MLIEQVPLTDAAFLVIFSRSVCSTSHLLRTLRMFLQSLYLSRRRIYQLLNLEMWENEGRFLIFVQLHVCTRF